MTQKPAMMGLTIGRVVGAASDVAAHVYHRLLLDSRFILNISINKHSCSWPCFSPLDDSIEFLPLLGIHGGTFNLIGVWSREDGECGDEKPRRLVNFSERKRKGQKAGRKIAKAVIERLRAGHSVTDGRSRHHDMFLPPWRDVIGHRSQHHRDDGSNAKVPELH